MQIQKQNANNVVTCIYWVQKFLTCREASGSLYR